MLSPLYGQLSPLRIPTKVRQISTDADANAYLLAVEAADGQELEAGVIAAVEAFVVGCKSDGIWSAIKASCILAGARTLSGALVPLVGSAPTNFNFVSADYNRETGLIGNNSTKYLDSNRNNNTDPQNNNHLAAYHSTIINTGILIGIAASNASGNNLLATTVTRSRNSTSNTGFTNAAGFTGTSRNSSADYSRRNNSTTSTVVSSSQAPQNGILSIFRSGTSGWSAQRVSYYSIGESLDLAKLDTRVSNLMTALAAAIP